MDEAARYKAESTALFAVRVISNCLLVVSFDAAFGMLFGLSPILVCISAGEMLVYLALAMLLRRRFKSFPAFALVHITGLLLVTFGAPYMFYVHLVEASWISSLALYDYISGMRMLYPGIGHVLYPFLIFIAGFTTDNRNVIILAVAAETCFLILFMLKRNLDSLDSVFGTASKYVRVPYGKMRRMNSLFAVFFVLSSLLLAVILGLFFDGKELICLIGKAMVFAVVGAFVGIVWIFSHLFPHADSGIANRIVQQPGSFTEILEEHPILMMLWRIFEFTIYMVTFVLIVYFTYRFVRNLYYEFRTPVPENGDKRVYLEAKEEREDVAKKPHKERLGFGPGDRVRRKYIRLVRGSGKLNELTPGMTPREIEEKIAEPELTELHDIYEKARYGQR